MAFVSSRHRRVGPRRHPTRLPRGWLVGAVAVMVAVMTVSLTVGALPVGVGAVLRASLDRLPLVSVDHGLDATTAAIITEVRLPRVVLAGLVGSVLAAAGGAYQATFRNPLADPFLLGAAAGAGLGVTVALAGPGRHLGSTGVAVTAVAFGGAAGAVALAYGLGTSSGGRSGASLILAGVAVAALLGAVQNLLLQRDNEAIRDVYAWLLGRFNVAGWDEVRLLAPTAALAVLVGSGRQLDVITLGDDEARALGVDPGRLRLLVVAAATLGTAAAVAVSGLIGFVGIVVPHAIRLCAGASYRRILPLAAALGAPFLCLADLVARTVLAPAEVPIGVITATLGGPFFLFLLRRSPVGAV
ncbi:MAG: FecCD family ABC transporter permease [Acidimicrobiales bacterium]